MIRWWAVGVGGRGGLGEHLGALAGGVPDPPAGPTGTEQQGQPRLPHRPLR